MLSILLSVFTCYVYVLPSESYSLVEYTLFSCERNSISTGTDTNQVSNILRCAFTAQHRTARSFKVSSSGSCRVKGSSRTSDTFIPAYYCSTVLMLGEDPKTTNSKAFGVLEITNTDIPASARQSKKPTPDPSVKETNHNLKQREDLIKKLIYIKTFANKKKRFQQQSTQSPGKQNSKNHGKFLLVEARGTYMNIFIVNSNSIKREAKIKEITSAKTIQYRIASGLLFFVRKNTQQIFMKNLRGSGPIIRLAFLEQKDDAQILRMFKTTMFVATKTHVLEYRPDKYLRFALKTRTSLKGVKEMEISSCKKWLGLCAARAKSARATYSVMRFTYKVLIHEMLGPCKPIFLLNGIFHITFDNGFLKYDIRTRLPVGAVKNIILTKPFFLIDTDLFMLDSQNGQMKRTRKPWKHTTVVLSSSKLCHHNWFFSIF